MYMNIYISPQNEKLLQKYKESGKSMSGLINAMIIEHFNHDNYIEFRGDEKLMLREFYTVPTDEQLNSKSRQLNIHSEIAPPS
jgi:hypothetical protein